MEPNDVMNMLQEPFAESDIEWRVQRSILTKKGSVMIFLAPYISNRAIMNRLDATVGPANWKNSYDEWREKGVICKLSLKIDGEWITKEDGAEETDIEGVKGSLSGSMKRAGVQWGIGRYLYNLDEFRVYLKEDKESENSEYFNSRVKIDKDKFEYKKGYWTPPRLPSWAVPQSSRRTSNNNQDGSHKNQSQYDSSKRADPPPNQNQQGEGKISSGQLKGINSMAAFKNITDDEITKLVYMLHGANSLDELNGKQAGDFLKYLNKPTNELKAKANGT